MGMSIMLYVEDNSIESPYLSRRFHEEIIEEAYFRFADFLTAEEMTVIHPNPYGEIVLGQRKSMSPEQLQTWMDQAARTVEGKMPFSEVEDFLNQFLIISHESADRERDPSHLLHALQRTAQYLTDNADVLPLVHTLHRSESRDDEVEYVEIDGIKGYVEGDIYYYKDYSAHRQQLHIRSYWEDSGKIDFYVYAQPEIVLDGQPYFVGTITKAEQFRPEFQVCYDFLQQAIRANKKVFWEIG